MAEFDFVTQWEFDVAPEVLWREIEDTATWPTWWSAFQTLELVDPGDADGLNRRFRGSAAGPLGYALGFEIRVVDRRPGSRLVWEARGDLEGDGWWELVPTDRGTRVDFRWTVRMNKRWVDRIAPLAKPLFRWDYGRLMARGAEALAARVDGNLLSASCVSDAAARAVWSHAADAAPAEAPAAAEQTG